MSCIWFHLEIFGLTNAHGYIIISSSQQLIGSHQNLNGKFSVYRNSHELIQNSYFKLSTKFKYLNLILARLANQGGVKFIKIELSEKPG